MIQEWHLCWCGETGASTSRVKLVQHKHLFHLDECYKEENRDAKTNMLKSCPFYAAFTHLILGPRCEGSTRTFLLFFPSGSSTCSTSALVWNPVHEVEATFPFCSRGTFLCSCVWFCAAFCCLSFPSSFCSFWGLPVAGFTFTFCCIKQETAIWFLDEDFRWK